jgi:hypothetical protein
VIESTQKFSDAIRSAHLFALALRKAAIAPIALAIAKNSVQTTETQALFNKKLSSFYNDIVPQKMFLA